MLAGARLGDDALLAHALGEQDLAERVVDLVRAGVEQVFALEINLRAAELAGQPLRKIERRGPAGVIVEQRRSSAWKPGSSRRLQYSAVSSFSAVISVSGTNMPP